MRIFNCDKTEELTSYQPSMGKLVEDRLLIAHHDAIIAQEEQAHYEVVAEYPNGGKDVEKIIDVPAAEGREAYDEYEKILVCIPYTEAENKDYLRSVRVRLLSAFDKWEKAVLRQREQDDELIMAWYRAILDLEEEAFENVPARIIYYE